MHAVVEWLFIHYFLADYEGLETDDDRLPLCVLRPSSPPSKTSDTSVQGETLSCDKQREAKWIKCMLACTCIQVLSSY